MAHTDKFSTENMNIIHKLFVIVLSLSFFVLGLLGVSLFATYQWRNTYVPTANWESVKSNDDLLKNIQQQINQINPESGTPLILEIKKSAEENLIKSAKLNELLRQQADQNRIEHESAQSQAQNFIYALFVIVILILILIAYIIFFFSKSKNRASQLIAAISNSGLEVVKMSDSLQSQESSLIISSKKMTEHFGDLQLSFGQIHQLSDKKIEEINKAVLSNQTSSKAISVGIDDIGQLVELIKKIRTSSAKILEVSKVIDGVAYQTNLLALNAAVEASRAGEHGKGFAVVAEAVQVLAQKAAAATKEINSVTKEAVASVENGTVTAVKISTVFQSILDSVKQTENFIGQVTTDSNQQSQSVAGLNRTLVGIEKEMKSGSTLTNQMSATNKLLKQNSQELQTLTSEFANMLSSKS